MADDRMMDNNVMKMDVDAVQKDDNARMGVETEAKKKNEKKNGIDSDTLITLLKASKKAGDLIANKNIMLLIGNTGAGKVSRVLCIV